MVVVGLTAEQETEAVDKTTLSLPGAQDALVSAVAAAAARTVVVVNAATPVLMPWLAEVDAVLWAGLPGQEAGRAVAAALLGDIEPAGRLVSTFPAADGAAPAWSVTPVHGTLVYAEGTFIGHRGHYAGRAPVPAFWFGHGLGYSSWSYGRAAVDGSAVTVEVTNTGGRTSREVVQVYLEPADADQPVRLVGWSAVTRRAGPDRARPGRDRCPPLAPLDRRRLGPSSARRPPPRRPRPRRHPRKSRPLVHPWPITGPVAAGSPLRGPGRRPIVRRRHAVLRRQRPGTTRHRLTDAFFPA